MPGTRSIHFWSTKRPDGGSTTQSVSRRSDHQSSSSWAARRAAEADEAEVVGTGDEDRLLRRVAAVARDRREVMRRQDDAVLGRELADLVQRRDDPDVGVEIHGVVLLGQELSQQPRLHRGRQLDDAVGRHHLLERLAVDVLGGQQAVGLLRRVDIALDTVEDEHGQLGVRVLLAQGQGQDPRVGEVVLGDDRADVHRAIVAVSHRAPTPRPQLEPRIRSMPFSAFSRLRRSAGGGADGASVQQPATAERDGCARRRAGLRDAVGPAADGAGDRPPAGQGQELARADRRGGRQRRAAVARGGRCGGRHGGARAQAGQRRQHLHRGAGAIRLCTWHLVGRPRRGHRSARLGVPRRGDEHDARPVPRHLRAARGLRRPLDAGARGTAPGRRGARRRVRRPDRPRQARRCWPRSSPRSCRAWPRRRPRCWRAARSWG